MISKSNGSEDIANNSRQQIDQYVLDGGSLLHRVKWLKNVPYKDIIKSYCDFVLKNYNSAIVVFYGYKEQPSTKDVTHFRRNKKTVSKKIIFSISFKKQFVVWQRKFFYLILQTKRK